MTCEEEVPVASDFTHAICRRPSRSVVDGIADFANEGKPIYEKALEQHDAYVEALRTAGLEVTVLPALEEFPDSVFVEDTCVITPSGIVVSAPSRHRLHRPTTWCPPCRVLLGRADQVHRGAGDPRGRRRHDGRRPLLRRPLRPYQ